ncbi:hypothetical protein C8R45DRAFT_1221049 [Mycena sanguinolenta]|nr:hypothetical protein C8R45DRAFT_1221049 [Mycena sanguinolenta]
MARQFGDEDNGTGRRMRIMKVRWGWAGASRWSGGAAKLHGGGVPSPCPWAVASLAAFISSVALPPRPLELSSRSPSRPVSTEPHAPALSSPPPAQQPTPPRHFLSTYLRLLPLRASLLRFGADSTSIPPLPVPPPAPIRVEPERKVEWGRAGEGGRRRERGREEATIKRARTGDDGEARRSPDGEVEVDVKGENAKPELQAEGKGEGDDEEGETRPPLSRAGERPAREGRHSAYADNDNGAQERNADAAVMRLLVLVKGHRHCLATSAAVKLLVTSAPQSQSYGRILHHTTRGSRSPPRTTPPPLPTALLPILPLIGSSCIRAAPPPPPPHVSSHGEEQNPSTLHHCQLPQPLCPTTRYQSSRISTRMLSSHRTDDEQKPNFPIPKKKSIELPHQDNVEQICGRGVQGGGAQERVHKLLPHLSSLRGEVVAAGGRDSMGAWVRGGTQTGRHRRRRGGAGGEVADARLRTLDRHPNLHRGILAGEGSVSVGAESDAAYNATRISRSHR